MQFYKSRIAMIVSLSLLVLGTAEGLARLFIPANAPFLAYARQTPNDFVRSGWTPNWRGNINIDGIGGQKGNYELRINPFGFRGQSMQTAEKPAGTRRVFFMGGSFVEEMALPEEKTFPSVIEKKLSSDFPEEHFQCVNAGISGFMSPDLLAQLRHQILEQQPDLIVLTVPAVNDIRYGTLPEYDPQHPLPSSIQTSDVPWFARSRLFYALYRFIGRFSQKHTSYGRSLAKFQREAAKTPYSPIQSTRSLETFAQQLRAIIDMAQQNNIQIILTAEPSLYQTPLPDEIEKMLWMGAMRKNIHLAPDFLERHMLLFNQTARQIATEANVSYIPLDQQIQKDKVHFYDDVHLTPTGSRVAANALYPDIKLSLTGQDKLRNA